MLKVTSTAATVLNEARADAGAPESCGVRFFASSQQGKQPTLAIGFAEKASPGDQVIEHEGITTFVAPEVAEALNDKTLDARETEGQQELFIRA